MIEETNIKKKMGEQKRRYKFRITKKIEVESLHKQRNRSLASIHESVGSSIIRYIIVQSVEC